MCQDLFPEDLRGSPDFGGEPCLRRDGVSSRTPLNNAVNSAGAKRPRSHIQQPRDGGEQYLKQHELGSTKLCSYRPIFFCNRIWPCLADIGLDPTNLGLGSTRLGLGFDQIGVALTTCGLASTNFGGVFDCGLPSANFDHRRIGLGIIRARLN